jgi:hypothetical protein
MTQPFHFHDGKSVDVRAVSVVVGDALIDDVGRAHPIIGVRRGESRSLGRRDAVFLEMPVIRSNAKKRELALYPEEMVTIAEREDA